MIPKGWVLRDPLVYDDIKQDITNLMKKFESSKHYLILDYPSWDDTGVFLTIYYHNDSSDYYKNGYYAIYQSSHEDHDEDIRELALELGKELGLPVYEWETRMIEVKLGEHPR